MLQSSFSCVRDWLLHILLPRTCFACKKDLPFRWPAPLCRDCASRVRFVAGSLHCHRCGQPLADGGAHCAHCRGSKAKTFKCVCIRSAVVFGPQIRPLIHAFKYAHQTYLASFLAGYMARAWPSYEPLHAAQLIMPVPLHYSKYKKRGYNQSALLARALATQIALPVDETSLRRSRNTPSQTGFGRQARFKNMKDAFECVCPNNIKGKTILLLDDVATTGATLEACAVALKKAGAKQVMAYTLAREM